MRAWVSSPSPRLHAAVLAEDMNNIDLEMGGSGSGFIEKRYRNDLNADETQKERIERVDSPVDETEERERGRRDR